MRILFVAMSESIHVVRHIGQLSHCGWDLHLFPTMTGLVHTALDKSVKVHAAPGTEVGWPLADRGRFVRDRVAVFLGSYRAMFKQWLPRLKKRQERLPLPLSAAVSPFIWAIGRWVDDAERLARVIRKVKPDVIHSLEFQHGAYVTLEAKKLLAGRGKFPLWVATNFGADIDLFGRLPEHESIIREVLAECDYYDCESDRDVALARRFGYEGPVWPVVPNAGGFDLKKIQSLRTPGPTSARRLIVLKGYQGWVYRALTGLRAIEMCADLLKERGYRVAVYLASDDVGLSARLITQSTGLPIDIIPYSSHDDMLRLHGQARASIGLSLTDACSTSFLEAIAMGSFPIQSSTSTANEWIRDGETGIFVHPEDPRDVAQAIRRAVTDDAMVDRAAEVNAHTVRERLDYQTIQRQVVGAYKAIEASLSETSLSETSPCDAVKRSPSCDRVGSSCGLVVER
jgi:glycosyltransferase involved in cell wall biosynthesis